jgi:hypothetical protein
VTLSEISNLRLINQKIEATTFTKANEVVSWMGAIQAQDFAMSKWAIGKRMLGATDEIIETALNDGLIIRTHLLRPTWHLVSTDDIYWMIELTAPRIKSLMKSRDKELGITHELLNKSFGLLEKELSNGINLGREQIAGILNASGIKTNENRLSHILMNAELAGLICSGRRSGNKITFGLLSERVPVRKVFNKDESLAELAKRYFTSHGPASLKDFTWWSGLSVADATKALNLVALDFISLTVGSEKYWLKSEGSNFNGNKNSIHLLPAFDEFLISYRERNASLELVHNRKAISVNGIFYPVIVLNGQVVGTWKRTVQKGKVKIETNFFIAINEKAGILIEKEIGMYTRFLNGLSYDFDKN